MLRSSVGADETIYLMELCQHVSCILE